MSRFEFRLPDVGEGLAEAEIVRWLVGLGDAVAENDPIAELETDKAIITMPSPATGTVSEFLAQPGERVKVGAVLVALDVAGAQADLHSPDPRHSPPTARVTTPSPSVGPSGRTIQAVPAARKVASELGVDLASVIGTGPQGRITVDDVRAARRHEQDTIAGAVAIERVPVRGLRRRIAEAMTRSARA